MSLTHGEARQRGIRVGCGRDEVTTSIHGERRWNRFASLLHNEAAGMDAATLRGAGIEAYEIKRDSAEQRDRPGVRLATMNRVKGLVSTTRLWSRRRWAWCRWTPRCFRGRSNHGTESRDPGALPARRRTDACEEVGADHRYGEPVRTSRPVKRPQRADTQ